MIFHDFWLVSMAFQGSFMVFQGSFMVFSWLLVGFHGFSGYFHVNGI